MTGGLPEACEGLLLSLSKAEADLKCILNRLKDDFSRRCGDELANPLSIQQRLIRIQRELPALRKEVQETLLVKQELLLQTKHAASEIWEKLNAMEGLAGLPPSETEANLDEVNSCLSKLRTYDPHPM